MRTRVSHAFFFLSVCVAFALPVAAADLPAAAERRASFDFGWLFAKGDLAGAAQPEFTDKDWRKLDLPHDWAIEGPFDKSIALARRMVCR